MANFLSDLWQQYTGQSTAEAALGAQNSMLGQLNTTFQPWQAAGPGAAGGYNPSTGQISATLSPQLQAAFGGLTGFANMGIANAAGNQALPQNVMAAALRNQQQQLSGISPNMQMFAGRTADVGQAANIATAGLGTAGGLNVFNNVYNQQLGLLRQQAQPQEQQQMRQFAESMYGSGQRATTGGALQTEAFARGLGQADIGRQLAATQQATNVQNLQDQLLTSAFGRFAQTQGLASDLQAQMFGQGLQAGEFNRAGTAQNLQNQVALAQLPYTLQTSALSPAIQALTAQGQLQQQAWDPFKAALQAGQIQGNIGVGVGANLARVFNPQIAAGVEAAKSGATQSIADKGLDIFGNIAGDYLKENAGDWASAAWDWGKSLFSGGSAGSAAGLGLTSTGAAGGTGSLATAGGTGASALGGAQGAEAFGAPAGWDSVGQVADESWLKTFNDAGAITNAVNSFLGGKATEAFIQSGASNEAGAWGATLGGAAGSLIPIIGPVTGAAGAIFGGIIGNMAGSIYNSLTGNADQDWSMRFQTEGDKSNFENGTLFNTALGQFGMSAQQTRNMNNMEVKAQLAPTVAYFKAMDAGIAQALSPGELEAVKKKINGIEIGSGSNSMAAQYGRDPKAGYTKQRLEAIKAVMSPERLKETGFDKVIDAYNANYAGLTQEQADKMNMALTEYRTNAHADMDDWGYSQKLEAAQASKELLGQLSLEYTGKDITNDQGQDYSWDQYLQNFQVGSYSNTMMQVK